MTSEQGTLLLAITPMGAEQTDSAEACKKLCEGMGVACLAWAWCDAATIGG